MIDEKSRLQALQLLDSWTYTRGSRASPPDQYRQYVRNFQINNQKTTRRNGFDRRCNLKLKLFGVFVDYAEAETDRVGAGKSRILELFLWYFDGDVREREMLSPQLRNLFYLFGGSCRAEGIDAVN